MLEDRVAKRNLIAVTLSNLFRGIAVGGMQALFSLYMSWLGYSMSIIGIVISVSNIISAITLPAIGYLIDTYGPRRIVFGTGLMLAIGLFILEFPSLIVLAASYTLFLLAFFYGQPARTTFLAHSVASTVLGTSIGVTAAVFSASRTAGPALGGYAVAYLGYKKTFLILSFMAFLSSVIFIILSSETTTNNSDVKRQRSLSDAYKNLLRQKGILKKIYLMSATDRFGWSLWFPMLSAHLYKWGYTEEYVGLIMSGQGLVQSLVLPIAGRITDKMRPGRIVALSEVFGIISAILLSHPLPAFRATSGLLLLGLSIAFWIPGYNSLIAQFSKREELGKNYATANVYRSVASIPSPYIGGLLYDAVSPVTPFLLSTIPLAMVGYSLYKIDAGERV